LLDLHHYIVPIPILSRKVSCRAKDQQEEKMMNLTMILSQVALQEDTWRGDIAVGAFQLSSWSRSPKRMISRAQTTATQEVLRDVS